MATDADVLRYLSTLDFPADKGKIIRTAEQADAPYEVIRALRALPPVDYANTNEVTRSAGTEVAPEQTPAQASERARDRQHQRVARHLRGT